MRADDALARGRSALGRSALGADGGRDAELLLRWATGWERAFVLTHPEAELSAAAAAEYEASLLRRSAGEPVQYITGVQEFWGLGLKVTPAVLIPRPETEHLVEAVMARVSREGPLRIADVGTGSGAIAIALAKELPNATVVATDISDRALEVAGDNAARHGVKERIQFEECDLLPAELVEALDVVASNPPYIGEGERETLAREVREFEPGSALFAGATGYEVYERLIPAARKALKADGWLVMEMGAGQEARLRELLAEWRDVSVVPDLQGIARVVCARKRGRVLSERDDHLIGEMKKWFEGGFCSPKMEPSLLGLDWSSFETRKFPEHDGQTNYMDPPEFVSHGFSALDAYATAMLAAHFSWEGLGLLTFTCKLKHSERGMSLDFTTATEQGRIDSGRIMLELLRSFPILLSAKNIEGGAVLFLDGEGCPMQCNYPGRMIASVSQFLRDRPVDLWPQAMLVLMPTVELRRRAQDILSFLRSSDSMEENPN